MCCMLFWIIMLLFQQTSNQIINMTEKENTKVISYCLSKVIQIVGNLKVAMWYSKAEEYLAEGIIKKTEVPIVLNAVEHPKKRGLETRVSAEIIIILNKSEIGEILNNTLWNGETRFFTVRQQMDDMKNEFEIFWKFKIVNVFSLFPLAEDVMVYSFLPYGEKNCGVGNPFIVEKYDSRTGNFDNTGKAFKDSRRIKNLNQCPVNITVVDVKPNVIFEDETGANSTSHIQGIEGKLLNEVARRLNFNATFLIAVDGIGWGWIRPSPHGAVGEVYTGRSDFAMGLLAPTIERYESLDLSLPYNGEECITYGVPTGAGASTPNWITILVFEFGTITWVLIIFSFILIFFIFLLINKVSKRFSGNVDIILFIFSSCLGLPVKTPDYFSLRLSLTFWIIFSFIVTVAYRSSMGSKLTVPNRDPDINTFSELLQSKLELTGYNNMLRLLQYNDSESYIKEMVNRFKVTDFDIDYAVDRIAAERKIAYVRHTTTFLYYALINPKAKGHIHVIKDCIMLYHPMVVTKKHSPFSYSLNQLISRLMESGITKRWRSEYIYTIPPTSKPVIKLSNDHMYGVFCILCFGYLLGTLSFIIEIVKFYKIYKKRISIFPLVKVCKKIKVW